MLESFGIIICVVTCGSREFCMLLPQIQYLLQDGIKIKRMIFGESFGVSVFVCSFFME